MKQEDRQIMDEILRIIRDELRALVTERVDDLFRTEFKSFYPGPWAIIEDDIEKAREKLEDLDWEYVEGVGLRRVQLRWKRDQLKEEAERGTLGGFLKRADTALKSFAKIPLLSFLEAVIEYKENVEASIERLDEIKKGTLPNEPPTMAKRLWLRLPAKKEPNAQKPEPGVTGQGGPPTGGPTPT